MPTFQYTYHDPGANEPPRTGRVEAADRAEALWQLASAGLDPSHVALVEIALEKPAESPPPQETAPEPRAAEPTGAARPADAPKGRLNDAEAEVLANELSGLVRSGLPLSGGLRSLADELGPGRTTGVLRQLADYVDAGQPLESALGLIGGRLPSHLRGLVAAGVASGRLSEVLESYVDLRRDQAELRRRMWLAVAYPLLLLALLTAIFVLCGSFIIPIFSSIYRDFGANLPPMTKMIFSFSGPGMLYVLAPLAAVVGLFLFTIVGPSPYWMKLCIYEIPIFGPFWRWSRLLPCARLLAMLVDHGTPLPEALRLMGDGLADRQLAARCAAAAGQIEAGRTLGESLVGTGVFPLSAMPLLDWGARFGSLPTAIQFIGDSFESRTRLQVDMAQMITVPGVLMVGVMVAIMILGLFLPLINLIEHLSG